MSYCENTDVVDEFKTLDTTGIVSTDKIDEWILQADAYIDGRIGLVYSVPVTGAESVKILKKISIGLVAQRVSRVLEVKSITPKGDQYIPKDLILEAKETLEMIVNRQMLLSDATRASTTGGVASYSGSNTVNRKFQYGVDQW